VIAEEKTLKGSVRVVWLCTGAYLVVLLSFLLGSFYPQYRVWGINWWAYYPLYVRLGLFVIGLLVPLATSRFVCNGRREPADSYARTYLLVSVLLILLYGLLFWIFRAQTHFLGDGYQQLSQLASASVFVKPTNYGGTILQVWLTGLLGDHSEATVLLSYQIVAISAGMGFLIVAALSARALFERNVDRLLFVLGLASGGYMLLFFGYVENYALFVLSVAVFSLLGLQIALRKANRFWVLPVLALAIFFHVFGVVLIPAALYLLMVKTRFSRRLAALPSWLRWSMALLTIIATVITFFHYYTTDYFFRFSLVPVIHDIFTVEGYTLFSINHLVDFLNLVILLLPGLPVVVAALFVLPIKQVVRLSEYRFLLILLVSALGTAFLFDPHLGMPRDWDLFSFAGVPLALTAFYVILSNRDRIRQHSLICILMISLGFGLLFPRVVSQVVPGVSVAHLKSCFLLDRLKTKSGRHVLVKYYTES